MVEPHLFVEGADGLHLKVVVIGVEVVGGIEQRQSLLFHHVMQCKLIHDRAVGLEVEDAVGANDFAVTVKELRRSEAVPCIAFALAGMRVRESDPNLGNFVLTEEMLDLVDAGAKKGHILQPFLVRLLQAAPDTRTFDVDPNIIDLGMHSR